MIEQKRLNNFGTNLDNSGHSGYSVAAGGPIFFAMDFVLLHSTVYIVDFQKCRGVSKVSYVLIATVEYIRHKGISTLTVKISQSFSRR